VPDFTAFRQEVFRLYARNPEEAIAFIRQNKSRYARTHTRSNLAQLAEHLRQSAIAEGIARGDLVADMAILGVSLMTIKLLEESEWHIVSLQQLVERTEEELLHIDELGQTGYREITRALQRYYDLEALKIRHIQRGSGG
jgi:DNA-directed RNA polymerase alpha subunit